MRRFRGGRGSEQAAYAVTGRNNTDGHKFFVDGGWVLVPHPVRSRSYAVLPRGEHRDGGYAARRA